MGESEHSSHQMENITDTRYNYSASLLESWLTQLDNGLTVDPCSGNRCSGEMPALGIAGILSLLLGSVGIVFNILSLLAIVHVKVKSTITTHFRLIASLACSDLLMGVSVVCYHIHRINYPSYLPGLGPEEERLTSRCLFMVIKALNSTSLLTTLFNLLGMAIDHYVAVMKPFHYQRLLNRLHGNCMIVCFWLLGAMLGFSDFYIESWDVKKIQELFGVNFCEAIWITRYQEEYWVFACTVITGISMLCIYIRIYYQIRVLQQQELSKASFGSGEGRLKRSFYAQRLKSLGTTLLILCTFLLCWLPICVLQVTLILYLYLDPWALSSYLFILQNLNNHLFNLLLVNTIMDPIIYVVRIRQYRNGYRRLFSCLGTAAVSLKERQRIIGCTSWTRGYRRRSTITSSLHAKSYVSDMQNQALKQRMPSED